MKTSTLLIPLSLLLLSFVCADMVAAVPVLDTDGNELLKGALYNIYGAALGAGPITIGKSTTNERCPQNVILEPFIEQRISHPGPIPATFYPLNDSDTVIQESTDLNIRFVLLTDCPSNVWRVSGIYGTGEENFITTGGTIGNPSCATSGSWFRIVPSDKPSAYKLIHNNEAVCRPYPDQDAEIILVDHILQGRLYLNREHNPNTSPLLVRFEKVSELKQVV